MSVVPECSLTRSKTSPPAPDNHAKAKTLVRGNRLSPSRTTTNSEPRRAQPQPTARGGANQEHTSPRRYLCTCSNVLLDNWTGLGSAPPSPLSSPTSTGRAGPDGAGTCPFSIESQRCWNATGEASPEIFGRSGLYVPPNWGLAEDRVAAVAIEALPVHQFAITDLLGQFDLCRH